MLHCKVITIDGVLSCVGSANFNHRSMLKDDEINVVILDKEICIQLNAHFDEDLRHCEKVDKERWKNRGLLKRSLEKASRVIQKEVQPPARVYSSPSSGQRVQPGVAGGR